MTSGAAPVPSLPGGTGLIVSLARDKVVFAACTLEAVPRLHAVEGFDVRDHSTFTGAVETYRARALAGVRIDATAIAIAGVPVGDTVNVTGGSWYLSMRGLEGYFGHRPVILNDFAARLFAVPGLGDAALRPIGSGFAGATPDRGTIALVGPLDGLGTAGLTLLGGERAVAIQSEAGNGPLAATSAAQRQFQAAMIALHGHFSAEMLLSEPGLLAAHDLFSGGSGKPCTGMASTRLVAQAAAGDRASAHALELFVTSLGDYCRSVVMTMGAWHGLYFCGPLIRSIAGELTSPTFRQAFERGGRYRRRLGDVPMAIVMDDHLDLKGAAAALAAERSFSSFAVY